MSPPTQHQRETERDLLNRTLAMVNEQLTKEGLVTFERNFSYREGGEELTGRILWMGEAPDADPWYKFVVFETKKPYSGKIGSQALLIPKKRFGVCIVPVVNGNFVMVRQHRLTENAFVNEFPRGWMRSDKQDPEEAARQKLFGELPGLNRFELNEVRQTSPQPIRENSGLYRASSVHYFVAHFSSSLEGPSEIQRALNKRGSEDSWSVARVTPIEEFDKVLGGDNGTRDVYSITGWYLSGLAPRKLS